MKRPIINEMDRQIAKFYPNSLNASATRLEISKLHLLREFERSFEKSFLFMLMVKTNDILTKNAVSSPGK